MDIQPPARPDLRDAPRRGRRAWRWLERLLLLVGVVSLGYFAYVTVEARLYQEFENRELDAILASGPPPVATTGDVVAVVVRRPMPAPGSTVGRIEIPRLGVSAVIRAGVDARTLRLAVGHIPGTALPGEIGNIGLAAHRDTFFRSLEYVEPDDEIRLITPEGTLTFKVERTNVVEPTDTWVLDPTASPTLTLVTCYPFTYIGAAPQRFIVRATAAQP
jgi:sortase A